MRRVNYVCLILLLLLLVVITGCGKNTPKETTTVPQNSASSYNSAPVNTTLIQGSPSGVLLMMGNGISECLNKTYPGSVINIIPGDPSTNIKRLVNGEAEFVFCYNSLAFKAIKDKAAPHPEIKAIAALKTSPVQFVMSKDVDALTFEDIIKKKIKIKINIGRPESATEIIFHQLLKQYNLTQSDLESWGCVFTQKGQEDAGQLFASGAIDGYIHAIAAPHTTIMENAQDRELRLLTFNPKVVDALCKEYGYDQATIPAGTYPFLKQDYYTLTDYTILATTDKVSDETAYKMARSLHQNLDYFRLIHASLKGLDEKMMIEKLKVPIHEGALKYYKEEGLVK